MPLPDDPKMLWPPKATIVTRTHMDRWSAWYSGDPDELAAAYGDVTAGFSASANPQVRRFFELDRRGGLRGVLTRMWWGNPTPEGENRGKLHIPVPGDVSALSADLLYAEPPTVTVPEGNAATAERIEDYVEDGLFTALREAAEVCSAMGGVYLRVVWDDQVRERPWLTSSGPDMVVPEWRWDQLSAATFWRVVSAPAEVDVYRHLERHEPGFVLHGLYVGTDKELGRRVALTDHPETAVLADYLDEQDRVETETPRLTAAYVPNMRPNRCWKGVPEAANYGRSDFSGVEGLFDSIDETWNSWMRDLRLGKARLVVPQNALTSLGKGKGAMFNADQELLVPLDLGPNPAANTITNVQFAIRHQEHLATLQEAVEMAVRDCGYSMQSMSGASDVAMTATEVTSRERRSMLTRGRKIEYNKPVLRDIIATMIDVDVAKFGPDGVRAADVQVEFPRYVFINPLDSASTVQLLRDAIVVSQATAIEILHPDWDQTRVHAEMVRLAAEEDGRGYVSLADAATVEEQPVDDLYDSPEAPEMPRGVSQGTVPGAAPVGPAVPGVPPGVPPGPPAGPAGK